MLRRLFLQRSFGLSQSLGMRNHARNAVCTDSGESEESVVDRDLNLADDVETVTEEEIVVSVNRTSERILHREDGTIRDPELHRLKRDVELITRDSFRVRVRFSGGSFGVRAGNSLVRDMEGGSMRRRRREICVC